MSALACFCVFGASLPVGGAVALDCLHLLCSILMQIFPLFHNLAIFFSRKLLFLWLIGNKTSCRPIRSVIILVINKSESRCAVVRFCYHSHDNRPNWTPLSPITITYNAVCVTYSSFRRSSANIHNNFLLFKRCFFKVRETIKCKFSFSRFSVALALPNNPNVFWI